MASLTCLASLLFTAGPVVPCWSRFEAAVTNPRRYADPYADVALGVVWTAPDGRTSQAAGFYDGGQTWRLRWSPDQLGEWSFQARFSDGADGLSGTFECVAGSGPGGICVDPANPTWFGFRDGRPRVIRGLHVADRFLAANWPAASRAAFLDWAQAEGYNLLSVASCFLNRDQDGRGKGWETPRLWPLDAAEFRRLEAMLDDLDRRGMVLYPFAGFCGQRSNYPRDPARQEAYLRYTLARLGPYRMVLYNVAGPEPNVGQGWMQPAEVTRLGELVARLDLFGHPLSVHNRTGDDPYRDSPWTTFGTLQGPKTLDRVKLGRGLLANHHGAKPLLAQETLWSGNKYHPAYSNADLRKNALVLHFCGAAVVFGDMDGDSSSGFTGSLDLTARRQDRHDVMRRTWDICERLPWWRLKPRPECVDRGWCLADGEDEYAVYLDSPATVRVATGDGGYQATWLDPQRPDQPPLPGQRSGSAFTPPDGGDDWILHLRRVRP